MKLQQLLSQLQNKPYQTRVRILWGVTAVLGIILLIVWGLSIKNEVSNVEREDLLTPAATEMAATTKYVKVERVEKDDKGLKIFFSVNNPENDILNFSTASEIKLSFRDTSVSPTAMTDRQNKPFVQKILSKTENFGILIFTVTNTKAGELSFENLYFERQPDKLFKESLELDIDELNKNQELRK